MNDVEIEVVREIGGVKMTSKISFPADRMGDKHIQAALEAIGFVSEKKSDPSD